MIGRSALLAAVLLSTAAPAKTGSIGEVFREACLEPLLAGTPIGDSSGFGDVQTMPPSGNHTGRQWNVDGGFVLSELKTPESLWGCQLDRDGVKSRPVIATGTAEDTTLFWSQFELISAALLGADTFEVRSPAQKLESARMTTIQSKRLNPRGRTVVAFVFHHLASNYTFMFAGEDPINKEVLP